MFIEIEKVIEQKKRNDSGSTVVNPLDKDSKVPSWVKKTESIELEDIRSFRVWDHGPMSKTVNSELTVLYMKGSKKDESKNPSIIIAEPYSSFSKRVGTVTLE